jgi:uncharacterized Zn-binding protein involved in type VI secretion
MSIKDKGLIMSDYFERILKNNQALLVKEMLRFLAVLLIDSPLAIEVNFKDYADCMKTILDYANPDSPYAMEATKVILSFLLVGRQDYFKLLFNKDSMFKLALILEMVGAPDNDSIQNLFLDNTFLVDLLFSAKNLELLCEFSRTLITLKAVERGTTNYTKVSEALKKMKFCDFLLHCVALNINDADQGQVQKKVQLMQNCWRLVDRGEIFPRANDFLELSRKLNPVLSWTADFQRGVKDQFIDAFEYQKIDQITQYSQTISKENFFHLILLMFQASDTMRDTTITVICKMMKKTQSQDWFEILKREFYFVPIGRATNLLELIMANNVGPSYIENSLAIISCIPNELHQNFWQTFPNKAALFDSFERNIQLAQIYLLQLLKDALWFYKMTLDTCHISNEEFICCRRAILTAMKVMYTKRQYDIVPTWEREHWFPETMNKILLEFLTNEDRKVLYTFFYSVIETRTYASFERYLTSQSYFFADELAASNKNEQLEALCFSFIDYTCESSRQDASRMMGHVQVLKQLLVRLEQYISVPDEKGDDIRIVKQEYNPDNEFFGAIFDAEPQEQIKPPNVLPTKISDSNIVCLLLRNIQKGSLNEGIMDEMQLIPFLLKLLESGSKHHIMLLWMIHIYLKSKKFEQLLQQYNALDIFHNYVCANPEAVDGLMMGLFLNISKRYPVEKHLEKLPSYIKMEPIIAQRSKELSVCHKGYESVEGYVDFEDIWDNVYDNSADVLRGHLILRDVEDPLIAQVLDENNYPWRCLINTVPNEVFFSFFSDFTLKELVPVVSVCSAWSAILSSNTVWRHIYENEWGLEAPDCPYKNAYKNKVAWVKRQITKNKGKSAVVGSLISHGGKVTSGNGSVQVGDTQIATEGSQVMCDIHGKTTISEVMDTGTMVGSNRVARVGDKCGCGAIIITGADACRIQ